MYVNGLFEELRKNRSGCWVGHTYLGILGYSDDNFLLAPSREALQVMLSICEKYAASHGLRFSTDPDPRKSKTKCLAFLQNEKVVKPVLLCGNELPWVSSCMHLGNTIVNTEKAEAGDIRSHDVKKKRACFIDKCQCSVTLWILVGCSSYSLPQHPSVSPRCPKSGPCSPSLTSLDQTDF